MSPRRFSGMDPEQGQRQAHANELMLAVAARLLGEARIAGAFPDAAGLAEFAARLAPELAADEHIVVAPHEPAELLRGDYKVELAAAEDGGVSCGCRYGAHSLFGRLRLDGVFDEQGSGFGISVDDPEQRVELTPQEEEVMRRAFARRREEGGGLDRPSFAGAEFRRAIAVPPQPGAAAQVLAVELYGDGVVVRFTYDDPVDVQPPVPLEYYEPAGVEPPLEALLAEAEAAGGNLEPNLSLRDDLGTRYVRSGGGRGGVQVAHGEACFAPAVPDGAERLVVASYVGTVEVDL